jgi:hypothetical protein
MTPKFLGAPSTAAILAILCFGISLYCTMMIDETYGKDLDYLEMKVSEKKDQKSD